MPRIPKGITRKHVVRAMKQIDAGFDHGFARCSSCGAARLI